MKFILQSWLTLKLKSSRAKVDWQLYVSSLIVTTAMLLPSLPPVFAQTQLESRANTDRRPVERTLRENVSAGHDSPSMDELLDRGNFLEAVRQIEQSWLTEYLNYFEQELPERSMAADKIADTLAVLGEQTGKKSALIYLLPTSDRLEILLLLPNRQVIRKSIPEANQEVLLNLAKNLRMQITAPIKRRRTSYLQPAQQMYQWLIAPLELELQAHNIETLIFCVGAGLRTLPLAVLHDGDRFLIETYSIGLIPAFNLTEAIYQDLRNSSVIAMGASQFEDLSPLPAVPVELQKISQYLWQGEYFLNEEFTVENLRSQHQSNQFQIIHLATHAEFRPGDPSNSYIQFWDDELTLDRMKQLELNNPPIELLVLSACQTAIGDKDAELGFAGLAVNSGVKSALASLWYVSDTGTLGLMSEFYQSLQTAPIKAEALRSAQIAMLQGNVYIENGELHGTSNRIALPSELSDIRRENLSHPYFWAGFTMIGSPW